jgi:crossover junction endodeoxyribonuclease RuvC
MTLLRFAMLVLGIDPGLQETGYSYVEGATGAVTLLRTGVIRTPSRVELPTRLSLIYRQLQHLLDLCRPSVVALEDIYATARFPRTAIIMGHVRGVVCLAAAGAGIRVISLPPASVKQAIAGFGAASKRQIQDAVGRFLEVPRPLNPH